MEEEAAGQAAAFRPNYSQAPAGLFWRGYNSHEGVFHGPTPSKLDAQIARLCVLFEDLRIEVHGLSADPLVEMDVTGSQRLYFLRRSIATLMEATSCDPA